MTGTRIEIVRDTGPEQDGATVIRLIGVDEIPQSTTFRIESIDDEGGEPPPGWPTGDIEPLRTRIGEKGVELVIGSEIADAPALLPGTPVAISVPGASLREELLWPSLPVVQVARRGVVVMSAERRRAEIAARARARRKELESIAAVRRAAERAAGLAAASAAPAVRRETHAPSDGEELARLDVRRKGAAMLRLPDPPPAVIADPSEAAPEPPAPPPVPGTHLEGADAPVVGFYASAPLAYAQATPSGIDVAGPSGDDTATADDDEALPAADISFADAAGALPAEARADGASADEVRHADGVAPPLNEPEEPARDAVPHAENSVPYAGEAAAAGPGDVMPEPSPPSLAASGAASARHLALLARNAPPALLDDGPPASDAAAAGDTGPIMPLRALDASPATSSSTNPHVSAATGRRKQAAVPPPPLSSRDVARLARPRLAEVEPPPLLGDGPRFLRQPDAARQDGSGFQRAFGLGFLVAAALALVSSWAMTGRLPFAGGGDAPVPAAASANAPSLAALVAVPPTSVRGVDARSVDLSRALELADINLHGSDGDKAEAQYWLRRALALGLADRRLVWAMTQLGTLYATPLQGEPEYDKARMLWQLAAAESDPVALCFLAALNEHGLGGTRDPVEALELYRRAKAKGGCRDVDSAIARLAKVVP